MFATRRSASKLTSRLLGARWASTAETKDKYKVVVLGGGVAGLSAALQLYNRFEQAGKSLKDGDIAIVDAAEFHHYQPGWTLVGSGLKQKSTLRRPLADLIPSHINHISENVQSFDPSGNSITTISGRKLSYDALVVATGLQVNFDQIEGLPKALADPSSGVSTIYSYNTCDKTWRDIDALRSGRALFTQPAGVIKCAGAPQKIMWMAWDRYRRSGRGDQIKVDFRTGMPTMFSVPKYSKALDAMRVERGVGAKFQHSLVSVDSANRKATFKNLADNSTVTEDYTLLHVTPPMGPLDVFKGTPLVDAAGWIDVDKNTLQHVKPEFANVFAMGDASSLPTSKTAAAITAQAPVLVENLFHQLDTGKVGPARYDGYTSCPLLTGYGELMLAEFKYGLEPAESFAEYLGDQATPRRLFYHLKKDLLPFAWLNFGVKGLWFGPSGFVRPKYS
ncbi:sulfide:quinone oxidoreductase [Heterobasidion irregulare TC 32-1]|uniref:Sulfide:quinone oxidoreductase, mitochondrial n=1 Tax=Heterobasidion irregulare (strain TC 32-1) TaxID=747525 RepID=W4KL04_HETIT|nr:sulfide:quinone oxidoreductase [Heterobasidion irregulare TC 32-1]ETW86035.1 sulfide:quinone oxidoreductase [Heterobasidion irregulare TC 32-1]